MPSYTENAFTAALNAVNAGELLRYVACDYGIPEAILYDCRAGRQAKTIAYTFQ